MTPTPNSNSNSPTPQQQVPWWQLVANGASGALDAQQRTAVGPQQQGQGGGGPSGGQQQRPGPGQQTNPWQQLAQNAGKFGSALKTKLDANAINKGGQNALQQPDQPLNSTVNSLPSSMPPTSPGAPPTVGANPAAAADAFGGAGGAAGDAAGDLGDIGADFAADGKVFTKPTLVVMGDAGAEQAVPLSYRSSAKVRPSAAMTAKPNGRNYYGG